MREFCTSGSAGGPGGVIPWGYPTVTSLYNFEVRAFRVRASGQRCDVHHHGNQHRFRHRDECGRV